MTKDLRSAKGKVDEGKRGGGGEAKKRKKQEKKSALTVYISTKGI